MSRSRIGGRQAVALRLPVAALLALSLAAVGGCGEGAVTRPGVQAASLDGEWSGSGSLYRDLGWSLTQHSPGDSITGEGYMDAPRFLDGFPRGKVPRYRIRGQRDGLFIELHFLPVDDRARALDFRGVMQRTGEVRGGVFLRRQVSRLDVIRVFLGPADTTGGGS